MIDKYLKRTAEEYIAQTLLKESAAGWVLLHWEHSSAVGVKVRITIRIGIGSIR